MCIHKKKRKKEKIIAKNLQLYNPVDLSNNTPNLMFVEPNVFYVYIPPLLPSKAALFEPCREQIIRASVGLFVSYCFS